MKFYLILVVIIIGNASCHHVYYAPNTVNVPLLSHKGETKINGLYSTGWDSEFNVRIGDLKTTICTHRIQVFTIIK